MVLILKMLILQNPLLKQREREREREREGRKTQSNYTGSFHKLEVVLSPLHVQGEFANVISNYKCSRLNLARDFKCSSTTATDFLCSWTQSRDFYAQAHKQETSKSNIITKKNGWHWTLDIQSEVLTIQIRYRLFKTLEFLRYELWKEILSELLDAEQFWQSLGTFKLLWVLYILQVFTPLYRGVRWTLWIASTSKKSRLKLW